MPKDFASRSRTAKNKPAPRRKPAPRTSPVKQKSVSFHGPSFSSGALIGAAIVLTAAYAPEFLRSTELNSGAEASSEQQPAVQFEFPKLLRNTTVQGVIRLLIACQNRLCLVKKSSTGASSIFSRCK